MVLCFGIVICRFVWGWCWIGVCCVWLRCCCCRMFSSCCVCLVSCWCRSRIVLRLFVNLGVSKVCVRVWLRCSCSCVLRLLMCLFVWFVYRRMSVVVSSRLWLVWFWRFFRSCLVCCWLRKGLCGWLCRLCVSCCWCEFGGCRCIWMWLLCCGLCCKLLILMIR